MSPTIQIGSKGQPRTELDFLMTQPSFFLSSCCYCSTRPQHSPRWFVQVGVDTVEQVDDGVLNSKSGLIGKLEGAQEWLEWQEWLCWSCSRMSLSMVFIMWVYKGMLRRESSPDNSLTYLHTHCIALYLQVKRSFEILLYWLFRRLHFSLCQCLGHK